MNSSNHRQSTNVKLAAIIHSKADDNDDDEELIRNLEKRAKQQLRRACLYGGGARTIVPKTKRVKKPSFSPFQLPGAPQDELPSRPLTNSIPPGAHGDLYRVVQNPTKLALNDADRICINSSRMIEGLRTIPQPPWYVGYNNTIIPPDDNPITAAARYGYRGSKNINQFNTRPQVLPSKSLTEHTPKFLQQHVLESIDYINEYVPPILAATIDSVNGIESPKLWPENTEFVEGYKLKQLPMKSWRYRRETTVDLPERPKTTENLSTIMEQTNEETKKLLDYTRMESQRTMQSLPMSSLTKFETSWNDFVNKDSSKTLKTTLNEEHQPYEAHTLLDPSDTMRYSGSTAMIVHSQSTEELKFRLRMEHTKSKVTSPFALKWSHICRHFDNISNKLKRKDTMFTAIQKIGDAMHQAALKNGSETALKRIHFVQACQVISFFEDVSSRQVSQLYSLFDPMKRDMMRYVEFLLLLHVLDHPEHDALSKIRTLWRCCQAYGLDRNIFDTALEILTCCAGSLQDVAAIEEYFKIEFRKKCYEFAIMKNTTNNNGNSNNNTHNKLGNSELSNSGGSVASLSKSVNNTSSPVRPSTFTASSSLTGSGGKRNPSLAESDDEREGLNQSFSATATSSKNSFIQHQYNISQSYLNENSFIAVLEVCPLLVETFNSQLSLRLQQCYGIDERLKELEEKEFIPTENLDFSWIIKKAPVKKESFGLFD